MQTFLVISPIVSLLLPYSDKLQKELEVQTTDDPRQLLRDARNIHPTYERFLNVLAEKSGGTVAVAPLKSKYRIVEKMVLRSAQERAKYPGACRIRDVVRGMVIYTEMGCLSAGFDLLASCDDRLARYVV